MDVIEFPKFPIGSVPVSVAARVYGKDPAWIREGLKAGWLNIGYATRDKELVDAPGRGPRKSRCNYYISPKKLYEDTGYVWEGEAA